MKKQLTIALGLAVLSSSAMASKARLEALGQTAAGSQFISDTRNVLLNTATLNTHKDFVTVEWGSTTNGTDAAATPRAEGGFFKNAGNMAYGLYMGNESNASNGLRAAGGWAQEMNNLDLMVAGDAGFQWGAALQYGDYADKATTTSTDTKKSSNQALRLGAIFGETEVFLNAGLGNTAETVGGSKFKGKSSHDLGVSHHMGDLTLMARNNAIDADLAGTKYTSSTTSVGVAKAYKASDKGSIWLSASYAMGTTKNNSVKTDTTTMPVALAFETKAKEWLVLRASVAQNVLFNETKTTAGRASDTETTKVAAGAGLVFGDLTIDGSIGNNAGATPTASDTSAGAGTLRTDVLMSRVSMTYRF